MHRTTRSNPTSDRRGMTLLEVAAALVVVSIVLGVCVVASDNLVNDSADRVTVQTMRALNRALAVYRTEHGVWPSASEPAHIDTPAARCIAALRGSPKSEPLVADLPGLTTTPAGWLTVHDGWARSMIYVQPPEAPEPPAPPAPPAPFAPEAPATTATAPASPDAALAEPAAPAAAARPDGHSARWLRRLPHPTTPSPFFASAGPDGEFGDISSSDSAQRTASLDNLYTFDLESMK